MVAALNDAPNPPDGGELNAQFLKTLKDAAAYPLWVESVDSAESAGTGSTAGTGALGSLVARTISNTLGWRARSDDPKGFLAALNNAFQLTEQQGVVRAKWTPRNFSVQPDMEQLSGPQAVLAERFQNSTAVVIPMLEGLRPLLPDSDPEDCAALVALIVANLRQISNEMLRIGGPVLQRIDRLFEILFGVEQVSEQALKDPQAVQGQLGALRDLFGYGNNYALVNLPPEETQATQFLSAFQYVDSNRAFYYTQREALIGGVRGFFGTQLIRLSRDLDAVAVGVGEVNTAMNSVRLHPQERQTVRLWLPGEAPLTLADLLDGITQLALTDGRFVLQNGGKDGVNSTFIPMVQTPTTLLDKLIQFGQVSDALPEGFYTPRVQFTLQNLLEALSRTLDDARNIGRDRVTYVDTQEFNAFRISVEKLQRQMDVNFERIALGEGLANQQRPAVAAMELGIVNQGEIRDFVFVLPDALKIDEIRLLLPDDEVATSWKSTPLEQEGREVRLTVSVSLIAQGRLHVARVWYTDRKEKSQVIDVQFRVG